MSEDDGDVVLGPDGQAPTRVDRDRRAPRFSWTPAYEATFFRSLCESVQLGLRENSSFKAEAWERAAQALQESHGAYPTKSHLINKSDNARKRFRLWRGLREDAEFLYNPVTRTVTATEEAWTAHIEREPLSRALRGRPFDHEDYMEILYPDVIGSGGAPKRIMKPRRRTDGPIAEDPEMPGTGILNLQSEPPPRPPGLESPNSRPVLTQTPTTSSTGSTQQRPTSTTIPPRGPPTVNASALTPPDETITQSRKRQLPTTSTPATFESPPASNMPLGQAPESPGKRRRTSSNDGSRALTSTMLNSSMLPLAVRDGPSVASPSQTDSQLLSHAPVIEELVEAVRSRSSLRWQEEALDVFFRDFADEDLDLQVKISESVLINECKAMVFCKMPGRVRQHWVRRFKESLYRQ
ncbi:Myb-DNA-bind-3 domain-containing protein [Fusarium keratoplasticum]|uniref:Myb-DNA-bind-3 domain-containing protein n=1 Tax=Fusarium keratoplasticum TaxID=1328300 RepID=A0ACC0QU72_9HYPO|nr:Myb-DNA-bind-3 domain-containing protein [Fusarium keratoplasticum]KAI8666322.1 Myb-DNA-bind-3 domain-containing protein [Fusarium keratoplasticum]